MKNINYMHVLPNSRRPVGSKCCKAGLRPRGEWTFEGPQFYICNQCGEATDMVEITKEEDEARFKEQNKCECCTAHNTKNIVCDLKHPHLPNCPYTLKLNEMIAPTKPDTELNQDKYLAHGKYCSCKNCKAFYKPDTLGKDNHCNKCSSEFNTITVDGTCTCHCHSPTPEQKECEHGNKGICIGCYNDFAKTHPEPHPPDTDEWEKEFDKIFVEARNQTGEPYVRSEPKPIIDFIRSEKEKSYQEGLHKGYEEESVKCHEHGEKAKQEGVQVGKQVAIEEIIGMVEGLSDEKCECSDIPFKHKHTSILKIYENILSLLKEKLTK